MSKLIIPFLVFISSVAFSKEDVRGIADDDRPRHAEKLPEPAVKKNVLKLNLSSLFFSTLSATYEFGFHERMSACLRSGYMFRRGLPVRFKDDNRTDPVIHGYLISPEFRFYPGGEKKNAPKGFYLGLNVKHSRYFIEWTRVAPYHIENHIVYNATTIGGFTGYQWISKKHLSFDLCFAGLGFGLARLSGGFTAPDANLTVAEQEVIIREYRKALTEGLGRLLGLSGMQVETTDNSLMVVVRNIPAYSARFLSLAIGYNF